MRSVVMYAPGDVRVEDRPKPKRMGVPLADGTLVATPDLPPDDLVPSLLAASDVLGTGCFGAVAAEAGPGKTVAVVGDGAVGLCAVLAARQLGAERIIAISRHPARQQLARGRHLGYVGVLHDVQLPGKALFMTHVHLHGGPAPVRRVTEHPHD